MSTFFGRGGRAIVLGLGLAGTLGLAGCQVDIGGQTLPSPYYLSDDVQYFPAGPEFILSNEAAALRAQNEAVNAPGAAVQQGSRPGYAPMQR